MERGCYYCLSSWASVVLSSGLARGLDFSCSSRSPVSNQVHLLTRSLMAWNTVSGPGVSMASHILTHMQPVFCCSGLTSKDWSPADSPTPPPLAAQVPDTCVGSLTLPRVPSHHGTVLSWGEHAHTQPSLSCFLPWTLTLRP